MNPSKIVKGEKKLSLLTELLNTVIGKVSAQQSTQLASKEIARQISLMLQVSQAWVLGWDAQANGLELWGEWKEQTSKDRSRKSKKSQSSFARSNPFLQDLLRGEEPVETELDKPQLKELVRLLSLIKESHRILVIPMHLAGRPLGMIIALGLARSKSFSPAEKTIGQIFANHAAVVLENIHLRDIAERRAAEIEGLRKASLQLTSTLDPDEVMSNTLDNAHRLLHNVTHTRIYLYERGELQLAASLTAPELGDTPFQDPRPADWALEVAKSGESLYLSNAGNGSRRQPTGRWSNAIIAMALQVGGRVLGVMEVAYASPRQLDEELKIMRLLADHAAAAMENARLHNLTRQAALTDSLTGLPNRRAFDAQLAEEIKRSGRYQHVFSLVMIDLNHFKRINDLYGHQVGDVALQDIARCLRARTRDTDFLARLGGDEFVLILPETSVSAANFLCNQLRTSVAECVVGWGKDGDSVIDFSTGIAGYPIDGEESATLLKAADEAMYAAKMLVHAKG
jgi:diguanylate cyclase (GGDEF)-like protein